MFDFITNLPEKAKKQLFGFFTLLYTIESAFLFISQNAGQFVWNTADISMISAMSSFGIQTVLMYKWAIAAAVTVVLLLWAGSFVFSWTYGSDKSRIFLIVLFFVILIMGVIDSNQGYDGTTYVWQNSYTYTGYSYIGHSWYTELAMSLMNTHDANGNIDGTSFIIGIGMIAILIALFPKGWYISLAMVIAMMYFISVTEDLLPWIMEKIEERRTQNE